MDGGAFLVARCGESEIERFVREHEKDQLVRGIVNFRSIREGYLVRFTFQPTGSNPYNMRLYSASLPQGAIGKEMICTNDEVAIYGERAGPREISIIELANYTRKIVIGSAARGASAD